jgi:ketosteroid isomerase-like protein
MSAEARKIADEYYDRFADGDVDGAMQLFAGGCATVPPAGTFDPAQHAEFGRAFKQALPDAHMAVARTVEAGDEVFILGRFRGTHTGDLVTPAGTVPASGRTIDARYADYFRVEGGPVAAHEVYWDQLDMLGQLGAEPAR